MYECKYKSESSLNNTPFSDACRTYICIHIDMHVYYDICKNPVTKIKVHVSKVFGVYLHVYVWNTMNKKHTKSTM